MTPAAPAPGTFGLAAWWVFRAVLRKPGETADAKAVRELYQEATVGAAAARAGGDPDEADGFTAAALRRLFAPHGPAAELMVTHTIPQMREWVDREWAAVAEVAAYLATVDADEPAGDDGTAAAARVARWAVRRSRFRLN